MHDDDYVNEMDIETLQYKSKYDNFLVRNMNMSKPLNVYAIHHNYINIVSIV